MPPNRYLGCPVQRRLGELNFARWDPIEPIDAERSIQSFQKESVLQEASHLDSSFRFQLGLKEVEMERSAGCWLAAIDIAAWAVEAALLVEVALLVEAALLVEVADWAADSGAEQTPVALVGSAADLVGSAADLVEFEMVERRAGKANLWFGRTLEATENRVGSEVELTVGSADFADWVLMFLVLERFDVDLVVDLETVRPDPGRRQVLSVGLRQLPVARVALLAARAKGVLWEPDSNGEFGWAFY